jgi:hypothetical protein
MTVRRFYSEPQKTISACMAERNGMDLLTKVQVGSSGDR